MLTKVCAKSYGQFDGYINPNKWHHAYENSQKSCENELFYTCFKIGKLKTTVILSYMS